MKNIRLHKTFETDVLMLCDIFEDFRSNCRDTFKLDPAHYVTGASLSWDCMLKFTKVELELLSDPKMYDFLASGIRGGFSTCPYRYAEANNKYMKSGRDPTKDESYIVYLDANNLYGHSMSQYLPIRNFKWLKDEEIDQIDSQWVKNISDESDTGYILEVDLDYPDHLHDLHNSYPFCIDKRKVSRNCKKLVGTLCDKKNYIIHYRNLKQAISHGLVL
jgi:hypothetical protein